MRIKALQKLAGLYGIIQPGEVREVPDHEAAVLIAHKVAQPVDANDQSVDFAETSDGSQEVA